MVNIFYHILFLIFSIFVLFKTVFYALYEIKTLENKSGGIAVIVASTIVLIFANIIVFFKGI